MIHDYEYNSTYQYFHAILSQNLGEKKMDDQQL